MILNNIYLKNFRNYRELNVDFNSKLNIIIGNNAQGKTNILESIYILSITKSFLGVNDKNLIKNGESFTLIRGCINDLVNTKKQLLFFFDGNTKKLKLDDNEIKKHSEYIGNLKVILFSPDNIKIIKDGPMFRRKFLNIEISQLNQKYINVLNEFNVVLKQRNEYLKVIKNGYCNKDYFDILNEKFVLLSVEIIKYRNDFIDSINKYIGNIFNTISGFDNLFLKYSSDISISNDNDMKNQLFMKINNSFDRDILYCNTSYGPHHDDFSFIVDNCNLSLYGSQGQLKMAILALKLSLIDVFKDISGDTPVVLLDDLFSELDVEKRNKIMKFLDRDDIQTFVTTTDINNINKKLIKNSCVYEIDNGIISSKKIIT